MEDGEFRPLKISKDVENLFETYKPTHVIHLAAKVGGIQDNLSKPAEYFDDNVLNQLNLPGGEEL